MLQTITKTTLKDVARAAGVSTASASRTLSGRGGVAADLHARIIAAAARLGYRGNWAASALATKRTRLIGWINQTGSRATWNRLLQGAVNRLGEAGYACLVAASGPLTEGSALPSLLRRGVEAVIFVGATPGPADMETLAAQVVPWVALAEGNEADPHRIDLGSDAGRELATRYLAELSHEQLAFLGVGCQGSAGAGQPVAIGADGRAVMRSTGVDRSEVKLAVGDLLAASDRPTAIICGSDTDAVVALRECVLRGIRVPEELSIIGFGDESFARHTVPALSTVRCAWTEIGVQAATSILSRIEGRAVEPYKPAVKLVIRESTGPAP